MNKSSALFYLLKTKIIQLKNEGLFVKKRTLVLHLQ